ncbi:MAG TPA: GntR family transcriptional regulator [Clostridiaceae bacterium]|nr:GntR family transcriptional regulator [Clostridiaceae bacterium]
MEMKKYRINKRPLYREEIKEALMDAITSGELKPGDRVVETRWAKQLGVSQSPIREAIRELEILGLIENIPYKGSFVREFSTKEIFDTYVVRSTLETLAINDAIRKKDKNLLAELEDLYTDMIKAAETSDTKSFIEADVRFHEAIVEQSDNSMLQRLWRQCYIFDNTKLSTFFSQESIEELARRHREIITAIREGGEDIGERVIHSHFQSLIDGMKNTK